MTGFLDNRDMDYAEYREKFHDIREEKRRLKKKIRRKRIITTLIVVAVIAVGFATKDLWMPQTAEFFEDKKETIINDGTPEVGNGFPIKLSQSGYNYITSLDGMPTVISDTHITMFNSKGGIYKKIQHLFANPVYYPLGDKLFVYDLEGSNFALYNKKGEIYNKKTDSEIVVAACGKNGKSAIVTQTDKASSLLTVYDEKGDAIFKWSGGHRIVNVSFNKDETGCIISTFTASGGKIVSRLYGFEFNKTEEVFKTADLECLVLKSGYCENGDMWIVGDSIFYRVAPDGSVLYSYTYDRELSHCEINDKIAVLVFDSVVGKAHEIRIFESSDTPQIFKTDSEIFKLELDETSVGFLTKNSFAFLNKDAKIISTAEIEAEYSDFVIIDDNAYFISYNQVEKIDFKTNN